MKVLAIDTSNLALGIAVVVDQQVLGEYITYLKKNHSVRAMPAINDLMEEVNVKPKELDRIVVAHGPGSYTGVRIGVTIAKTLAWSLNVPIVGVSSLEVLASNGQMFDGLVSPIFDARRGQVYTGLYGRTEKGFSCIEDDQILMLQDWLSSLKDKSKQILFLGNDVDIHVNMIKNELGEQAMIGPFSLNNPRPSEVARLGMDKPSQDIHSFVPNYIRLVEAEANWLKAQKQ